MQFIATADMLSKWLLLHGIDKTQLSFDDNGVYWLLNGHKHYIDWLKKHRSFQQQGMPKIHHKLLRAVIGKYTEPLRVFDACAGLGRDSFLLTLAGCEVCACERDPEIFCLLIDAYKRARIAGWVGQDLFTAIFSDASTYLSSWPGARPRPHVIYLDPMYPSKFKGQVKAESALLQHTVMSEPQNELLNIAKATALLRVVVKRPYKGVFLDEQKPTFSFSGKTTRYDVYQLA